MASAWTSHGQPGWRLATPHYAIYTTLSSQDLRDPLADLMEGALAQYSRLVPEVQLSPRPMDCYVFETRQQWDDFTQRTTGDAAPIYLQIRRGGYTTGDRIVVYSIGAHPTALVLSHEGWHQFVFRHFAGRLPPFLEEGLACTFENVQFDSAERQYVWNTSHNLVRAHELRLAQEKGQLWPLDQLIVMHAGDVVKESRQRVDAYYAQCWAFVKFMREADGGRHAAALSPWLADTAAGTCFDPTGSHQHKGLPWNSRGIPAMVEHYLEMELPQIDKDFAAFIARMAHEEDAPSPSL